MWPRNLGRVCAIVEKWNPYVGPHGIRQNLFGIIDILALDPERGVVGIQRCGTSFSEHWRKLKQERAQETHDWLSTPGTGLELWGWRKVKKAERRQGYDLAAEDQTHNHSRHRLKTLYGADPRGGEGARPHPGKIRQRLGKTRILIIEGGYRQVQ